MVGAPRAAVLLITLLLLAGCTSSPPSPGETTSGPPVTDTIPSPTPTAVPSPAPTPTPTAVDFGLVTVDADGYGLQPVSETRDGVVGWAEQYCEMADLSPCTGIADRGVPLCIEKWDCHPALLVPFEEGTAAFVSGGIFPTPTVYAVWHGESDPEVAKYGGARNLLKAYLLTVGVCPDEGRGDPRGATCPSL